ncbi:TetR/AcrR family transcriptional regulator [Vibrio salinus]|uniref:TetR/AcrR family transcriptional regulator n=1 Tax=Vibrio salinus TaxID=2899784 RepID=UPI001E4AA76D|nr:TetR/AcrR family transcriptional regulator [Vibrio salinus]MCE0493890.1 TetR/AcrR family transcriptional regulator [Vibrio salinus]
MSKKEHILDIAEALFNQFGYTAVGVDLIRDNAQVSKTSMYRHFGSKNKLIAAVLARRHKRFAQSLEQEVSQAGTMNKKLDAFLHWHFVWFRQKDFKGCMFMHAVSEFKESDSVITQISQAHKQWLKDLLTTICSSEGDKADTGRVEMALTFTEGMIIRNEFQDTSEFTDDYRKTFLSFFGLS